MRRSDREIKDTQALLDMLNRAQVMHLGLTGAGQAYVVPLHFGWEEIQGQLYLYFHSASEGKKISLIKENPACFVCVTGETRYIRGEEACDWSATFESLMMQGRAVILQDEKDKAKGLDAIMRHAGFMGQPVYEEKAIQKTCVCRIEVLSISGKSKAQDI